MKPLDLKSTSTFIMGLTRSDVNEIKESSMLSSHVIGHIALVGIGATAVMDAWLHLLARLGVPTTSFALVGRWVGHLRRGRFAHAAISKAEPVEFELGLGWLTHYLIGIAYAGLLVAVQGAAWLVNRGQTTVSTDLLSEQVTRRR
ncbi:DUF2938 domain-containing protein [Methyloversatilis sp. XJ19-49]|uniref:DUF2938 domain-containing protein n=1 Tax=Methyloversatilis sp. XJ19-49 TaxID=2963429 RepID=UPI00211C87E8|nr:DUF2938 domain-containing protein [Methyloversatilis sp. XJ19-49]MCQ9379328.1 DUF2938 domain-containing protein [Methyloversatilis sp. XJ19-49]